MTTTLARSGAVPEPSQDADEPIPSETLPPRLSAAVLYCENCGADTHHRILRLDRTTRAGTGRVRGVARCRECRWTHPFESMTPDRVTVAQILSIGRTSERSLIELPAHHPLEVGSALPDSSGTIRIQRLDTRDGRQVPSASSDEVSTVWAVRDVGATVPVSIVEGRRTRATRLIVPRDTRYAVGDRLTVSDTRLDIVALRARGRTWRRAGDEFPADEVQRLYCRPPALEGPGAGPYGTATKGRRPSRDAARRSRPRAGATGARDGGFRVRGRA